MMFPFKIAGNHKGTNVESGPDSTREVDREITRLDEMVAALRGDYELFFSGDRRIPPERERNEVRLRMRKLEAGHITNTSQKFRFQSLTAKFNAYQRLWDRIMQQIESGTYRPDKFKADKRVGEFDSNTGEVVAAETRLQKILREAKSEEALDKKINTLYKTYIETRRVTGESVNIPFDKFRSSIQKSRAVLEQRFGDNYEFKIAIENGKAKVKGIGKK